MSEAPAERVITRPAGPADCRRVFEWANDPETREASFRSEPIPFDAHERWYSESLAGERRILRIACLDGEPIGLIRFDVDAGDAGTAEIGINIAPEHRGRGLASPMLAAARSDAGALGLRRLIARIKTWHGRSIRAFERAGYTFVRDESVHGCDAVRYETTW